MEEKSDFMHIPAKKSLGQNFLKDEQILQKIASIISVKPSDLILEIGPGKGALTKYLIEKNCYYKAYEIDERMKPILTTYSNHIIYKDFLKSNLKEDFKDISFDCFYVIANIPYYITTPIIEHVINADVPLAKMVLLVQKEVAERFAAFPGTKEYGYFTVFLNYYFNVRKVMDVPRTAFIPVPNVDSAVVLFTSKERTFLNQKKYFQFLKECFANKRKTLRNNLKNYQWDAILKILKENQLSDQVRAEEIPSYVFEKIFLSLN
ncbi:MAG: ribosomal RNA small subunit methyltransferase A [Bacilli bacterium]|jgi:16S rRNA (adenine1518-N6/adenine1519-N6)-dimethyltransferase|nr:ribosomal RNA small subunit methyltransferase A [Bacilli bacterium]